MAKRSDPNRTLPLSVAAGMWRSGDAALMPPGYARELRNVQWRLRVLQLRPQTTYDSLASVRSFGMWFDNATGTRRLFAAATPAACHVKNSSGETWSATLGSPSGAVDFLDSVSYRGVLYFLTSDASRVPLGVFAYDGATLASVQYTSTFAAFRPRCVAAFKERLFYGGARFVIDNRFNQMFGNDYEYDASNWTRTNISASTYDAPGGATVSRITPTNTTTASMASLATGVGSLNDDHLTWTGALRNTSATYRVPMTAQLKFTFAWSTAEDVEIGYVRVPTAANGFRYRATVAGTTDAATEPVWPTTVGTTIADGTATWVCDGTDVAAETELTVLTISEADFQPFSVRTIIAAGAHTEVTPVLKYGNSGSPTYTLTSIDFSLQDGKTDGAPLKRNYGHQLTYGRMSLPFVNLDAGTGTISPDPDDIIYITEVGEPDLIRGNITYRVSEIPGPVTALRPLADRLIAYKRGARWVFAATENPSLPILPEGDVRVGAGALGPKCVATGPEGAHYYIGEDEIYKWDLRGEPVPLCGDAMRDEIMNKSSASWVESQSAPANRPLLAIDQRNREMWVYTQKGRLHCKQLDQPPGAGWTVHDAGGGDTGIGYQICDMAYNPTTGNMYFAFTTAAAGTAGVARLDPTVTPAEDSISTSGTLTVRAKIVLRPIETHTPATDILVNTLRLYHKVTADQTGQTFDSSISLDQGVSFTRVLSDIVISPLSQGGFVPLEVPIYQQWNTVQVKLRHNGKGGAANFALSRIEADIMVLRGHYPKNALSAGASTL